MKIITAKCIGCGEKAVLTEAQIQEARDAGMPMCVKCGSPMIVQKVEAKP